MQFENILFEKAAQTATITLNRPEALNAWTLRWWRFSGS